MVGGSCSRARWPPLRRRSGRLGRWPRSLMRPRDGLARGLCALPAACLRALASAVSRRLVLRRPPWRVLVAANAVFFSPLTTPFFSPWRWRAAMRKISVRGGKKQLCPRPPKDGRLSCGHGPRLGCVRGHREKAVCLPASGRARSACRAVCAVRALRRASPPSSGGQVRALKGFAILQREHRGTGTRLPALRSPLDGGDLTETRRIGRSPTASQPVHKNLCTKKPPL